ncbi:MAG: hypothetical protein ACE5FL_03150, partial [Myxococcota bacterium]
MTREIDVVDRGEPRVMSGAIWDDLCATLQAAGQLVTGEGVPATPRDRAEGFRYLTRFLAAGNIACVSHDDPDYPVFGRLMDATMPWGLDAPDCLYLHAAVRGDAVYRIHGNRGSANHLDIQVNFGHFAEGDIASWGTVSSLSGTDLRCDASGEFELFLDAEERPGSWLRLTPDVAFVMVRQYFNDWENERPADLLIERVGACLPPPPPTTEQIAARLDKLRRWLERGGALWERMSRGLLAMEPNSLVVHMPRDSDERAGMKGQAYGMGNFHCAEDEVVLIEFAPPPCHHWSVALANYYWESIDFAGRQSSLNGHQATLDRDGVFRGVISARDPGVPNWLDNAGYRRGSVTARFLGADTAPVPQLRRV